MLSFPLIVSASSQERKTSSKHVRSASLDSPKEQKSLLMDFFSKSKEIKHPKDSTEQNHCESITDKDLKEARNFLDYYYSKNGGRDAVLDRLEKK